MATNERMNSIKQTAVIEGDTHMNTNRQTATIEGDTMTFLAIPVAVFEIILLPFWLFFKGFKTPEAAERIVAAE